MTTEKSISLPGILKIFQLFFRSHLFRPPADWGQIYSYFALCCACCHNVFCFGSKCKNNFYMKKDNIALGLIKHIIWTNFED